MLRIGDKEYRDLEEQVRKNQEDIKYILEERGVLNQFGIKVVGQVDTAGELPESATYEGEFGDAFAVGTSEPYTLYIWTRAFSGQANPFWFNIGMFPVPSTVPGPEGPEGKQGQTGQRGSQWQSNNAAPAVTGTNLQFDQALDTSTGNVYQYTGAVWQLIGNIRGPQGIQGIQGKDGPQGIPGPQGPEGPAGPQGEFVQIAGELENINQLPEPTAVARSTAYLIPVNGVNHIYLISGTDELTWIDAGAFGGGTNVKASGSDLPEVDVTYLDLEQSITLESESVAMSDGGIELQLADNFTNAGEETVQRLIKVELPLVASEDIEPEVVDNKLQLKLTDEQAEKIDNAVQQSSTSQILHGTDSTGSEDQLPYTTEPTGGAIVQRQANGNITVPTAPQADSDAVSKKYVDDTEDVLQGQIDDNQTEIGKRMPVSGGIFTGGITVPNIGFSPAPAENSNPTYLVGMSNGSGSSWAPVSLLNLKKALGLKYYAHRITCRNIEQTAYAGVIICAIETPFTTIASIAAGLAFSPTSFPFNNGFVMLYDFVSHMPFVLIRNGSPTTSNVVYNLSGTAVTMSSEVTDAVTPL